MDCARAGDAVDDFVVDADADVAGKIVDERRRGLRPIFGEEACADFGELSGGDARADSAGHGAQGSGNDHAAGAEFFELFGSSDGHGSEAPMYQKRDVHGKKEKNGSKDPPLQGHL